METINIDDIPNDVLQEESDIINISRTGNYGARGVQNTRSF